MEREGVPRVPFETRLGEERLQCLEMLRALPGRRLVCRALWRGREVAAKLFVDPVRARLHWQREDEGIRLLAARGVATPERLHAGPMEGGFVLLCAWEAEGENAFSVWRRSQREARETLLTDLVALLARHHRAGLVQEDLHLKNFLLTPQGLLTLDGADVRPLSGEVPRRDSLAHLGLLLAQLPPDWEGMIPTLLARYGSVRGWTVTPADPLALARLTHHARARRQRKYLRKIFRDCTAFARENRGGRVAIWAREKSSPLLLRLLDDPDATLEQGERLKSGRTCTVWAVAEGDTALVVKRYNLKGWGHALSRCFRETRGAVSWRNAHRLSFHGIATPAPVALIEERRLGALRGRAWLITERVTGVDCRAFLTDATRPQAQREQVATHIVQTLRRLWDAGLTHGDLKASNLLVQDDAPLLLDLDAMHPGRGKERDVRRFLANWQEDPHWREWFAAHGVG